MKIIIVDTNIVFSALLNAKSTIGNIILNNNQQFDFYSSEHLRREIDQHREKVWALSKLGDARMGEVIYQVFREISFISDQQIPYEYWANSIPLVREVDMDDLPFVALANYLDGQLWTGDMQLLNGLSAKGFQKGITTEELWALM